MNTREVASEYRLAQWSQALQERNARGESIKEFCENRGISKNTYFYWQRKLRAAACHELQSVTKEAAIVPNGWAVCEESKVDTPESALIIEIGNSRVVAPADVSAEHLEKVCKVLMRLC